MFSSVLVPMIGVLVIAAIGSFVVWIARIPALARPSIRRAEPRVHPAQRAMKRCCTWLSRCYHGVMPSPTPTPPPRTAPESTGAPVVPILNIRGQRVILSPDLADIYGVETRVLNQAVKRNAARFPADR